jgi:hypothetical protein
LKSAGIGVGFDRIVDKNYPTGFWLGRNNTTANSWGGGVEEALGPYGIYVTLPDGVWHQICSIRSGTTHTIVGDGGLVSTSNIVSSAAIDTTALEMGATGGLGEFGGAIDDVRIYNRALSTQEVALLYALGQVKVAHSDTVAVQNGLVGYWPLDGNTTSWKTDTTQDVSGNGNSYRCPPRPRPWQARSAAR